MVEKKTAFDLSPQVIQTDFEIAAIQAVEEVFQDVCGCLFHFSQCMLCNFMDLDVRDYIMLIKM